MPIALLARVRGTHISNLNSNYVALVNILKTCSQICLGSYTVGVRKKHHEVLGWNLRVKEIHKASREWFILWTKAGRPATGFVAQQMRIYRARFKYALRACKREKNQIAANRLGNELLKDNDKSFWKSVKRIKVAISMSI